MDREEKQEEVNFAVSELELWNRSLNQIRFFRFYPIFYPIFIQFLSDFFRFLDFSRLLELPIPQL